MKIFNLPDLGEGLAEAEIREWYVAEGDEVELEQPIAAMETAKAVVDLPSPFKGRVEKLYGKKGDIIKTGAPLIAFITGEAASADAGTVVGSVEVGNKVLRESAVGVKPAVAQDAARAKASPAVRELAKSLNVSLAEVTATGPGGTITAADVNQFAKQGSTAVAKQHAEPLQGVRRAMAMVMAQSHREVVPVSLMDEANIQHWLEEKDFTIRLIRAISVACHAEPALNAHFDGQSLTRNLIKEVNLGLAVDTPGGLYVPVLKDIAQRAPAELRQDIERFKACAKKQSFSREDLQGATITLSNFGTIAGRYANPIVVPPMVAIIGIGKAYDGVVAVANKPVVNRLLPISLTFDHRAITGGEAARFLGALIDDMELSSHH